MVRVYIDKDWLAATLTASAFTLIGPAVGCAGVCAHSESVHHNCVLGRCSKCLCKYCHRYHILKLDVHSSFLTTFSCLFGRNRYMWQHFGLALAGDMFHRKIDKLFQRLPYMFGIVDDILTAWLNDMGRDHNATVQKVLRICRWEKLKLNKANAYSGVQA